MKDGIDVGDVARIFGDFTKYIIALGVRTVWVLAKRSKSHRLVTAYLI
ncbi:MAG: hypothetical protein ABWZ17_05485 [Candidatus Binatia bacterium]